MHRSLTRASGIVALVLFGGNASGQSTILGALEDVVADSVGRPHSRAVRALFAKAGTEWRSFPSNCADPACLDTIVAAYPREITWTIAFDGRKLGELTSRAPMKYEYYAAVGLEQITSASSIPTVGRRSLEFSGYLGDTVYRPLVAVSRPSYTDPQSWKPASLTPAQLAQLRGAFRRRFPHVSNCRSTTDTAYRPWRYGDAHIQLIKAYASRTHWSVAQVALQQWRCDGTPDDSFQDQWFVIDASGAIRFLGSEMHLVDAGDYDGDGQSEILFSVDGDDLGGYRLFYDNLTKHTEFTFVYH